MKLLSNRDKDRTHVRDLIGVGMEVSNKTLVFELKSKVSGTYVQPED